MTDGGAGDRPANVLGVAITSPGRPLWPAHGGDPEITKLDLARYFEAVADWMLPHVRGRPCSLVRAPEGVEAGPTFYQRHPGQGAPAEIGVMTVRGDEQPYMSLDTPQALAAAAQIGAVELHPWNCRDDALEVPGRLVFDLDPGPGVAFDAVVAAAGEVRDRLERLGLHGFCKTTGGKGLHVVAPLALGRRPPRWRDAKAFARGVCARMAADSPERYVAQMAKAKRIGRIFLDYLRNDRMATAVAPLSPRARTGAPVSMPLDWTQVRAGLDPLRFTVRTAAGLIKRAHPWAGYEAAERPLDAALERLGRGS